MVRRIVLFASISLFVLAFAVTASAGKKETFAETKEYKDGSYDKGIITDYSQMVESGDIEWAYVAPGVKLSDYNVKVGTFKNMSEVSSKRMLETLQEGLTDSFSQKKGTKGTLTTENAVYWAERSAPGKSWIPYAGYHLAQAGVGVEMIFRDSSGKIVAQIRHSGREGNAVETAAEEIVQDISDWVQGH